MTYSYTIKNIGGVYYMAITGYHYNPINYIDTTDLPTYLGRMQFPDDFNLDNPDYKITLQSTYKYRDKDGNIVTKYLSNDEIKIKAVHPVSGLQNPLLFYGVLASEMTHTEWIWLYNNRSSLNIELHTVGYLYREYEDEYALSYQTSIEYAIVHNLKVRFFLPNLSGGGNEHYLESEQLVNFSSDAVPPQPTREGYTLHWDEPYTNIQTDTDIYGYWVENVYKLTLNAQGGMVTPSSYNLTFGQVQLLPTPINEGLVFVGWFTDLTFSEQVTSISMPAYDLTLYAKWSDNYIVINGGLNSKIYNRKGILIGNQLSILMPSTDGMTYEELKPFYYDELGNLTVEELAHSLQVTLLEIEQGYQKITHDNDLVFDGWAYDQEGTRPVSFPALLPKVTNIYARWKPKTVDTSTLGMTAKISYVSTLYLYENLINSVHISDTIGDRQYNNYFGNELSFSSGSPRKLTTYGRSNSIGYIGDKGMTLGVKFNNFIDSKTLKLYILFDNTNYPTDCYMSVILSDGTHIKSTVTNDNALWIIDMDSMNGTVLNEIVYFQLYFLNTKFPNTPIGILNVDTCIEELYTRQKIKRVVRGSQILSTDEPVYGVLPQYGELELSDTGRSLLTLSNNKLLKKNLSVSIYYNETLIGRYISDNWTYDWGSKTVKCELTDILSSFDNIRAPAILVGTYPVSVDGSTTLQTDPNVNLYELYNSLWSNTLELTGVNVRLDESLVGELVNKRLLIGALREGTFMEQWNKLCNATLTNIYIDDKGSCRMVRI